MDRPQANMPLAKALQQLRTLAPGPGQRARRPPDLADALAALESLAAEHEELRGQAARQEAAYEEAQAQLLRYRELFEFAPDAYLVTDLTGNIREANHAASRLLNLRKEFLRGTPLPFVVDPAERRQFYSALAQLGGLEVGAVQEWEVRLVPRNGLPVEAALTVTVDADAAGRPAGLRWLVRDVTLRKQAEESLRRQKELADSLVDTAGAAVVLLDDEGRITRVNAYLEALSGCAGRDLLGRPWPQALVHGPHRERAGRTLLQARACRDGARGLFPLRAHDGRLHSIHWSLRPLAAAAGPGHAVLAVGQDVTDLQEAQQQALRLERLAAIGQMVTGLAHESRNALQRSRACLEMLRWKVEGRPDALDLVERMQKAQEDVVRLYEDVRDYAAPIRLDVRPCDLGELWREVWQHVLALCPGRDAALAEEAAGVDCTCLADGFRLRQVFRNVLENAVAATADPVRVVVAAAEATLAGRPALRVAVRDNGPGLGEEDRLHLFEPFYTTKVKGTGLGMAIAKRIVEAHGGDITVGSSPGRGAEIVITLPRETP
jgi:PAS domain S-box-containing protein